jgi:N-acetylneuraminate synthase
MTHFIAEFTTNHMGNYNVLEEMAIKAKEAGADFIKMQKKDIETYYSQEKLNQSFVSPYGKTYRDYRKIFEFSLDDFNRFDKHCKNLEIPWFVTVQDLKSLKEMLRFNLPMYKVASSSARDWNFIQTVTKFVPKNKGIVVSVGGSTLDEIGELLEHIPHHKVILQHCVAEYPCPLEVLRLGNVKILKDTFESDRIRIGYSGHEIGTSASVALAKRWDLHTLERHFCLSKHSFVHHIECSLEPEGFASMVEQISDPNVYVQLPGNAWEAGFGMSEVEEEFLEKQTYGNTFLGKGSQI